MQNNALNCSHYPACRGCQTLHIDKKSQTDRKIQSLNEHLHFLKERKPSVQLIDLGLSTERVRFDFTIEHNLGNLSMGLYDQNKKIVSIDRCPQLHPELQNIYEEFKSLFEKYVSPLITDTFKGSARLRIGPEHEKGLWLDWPHLWFKKILDNGEFLKSLLQNNYDIEIGQKGKKVILENGQLRLIENKPSVQHLKKYLFGFQQKLSTLDKNFPLYSGVRDFTQPSFIGASQLVQVLQKWWDSYLPTDQSLKVIEFGPGIGLFTKALTNWFQNLKNNSALSLWAFENDLRVLESFKLNLAAEIKNDIVHLKSGDFQSEKEIAKISKKDLEQIDLCLVNPPRSGLKSFTNVVINTNAQYCIYVSCYPESLASDLEILCNEKYKPIDIKIVDQFPQTEHFETCVLLQRIDL